MEKSSRIAKDAQSGSFEHLWACSWASLARILSIYGILSRAGFATQRDKKRAHLRKTSSIFGEIFGNRSKVLRKGVQHLRPIYVNASVPRVSLAMLMYIISLHL